MSASRLREARRLRGWSQSQLISELQRQARILGVTVMEPASLRTALSRWENGHVTPDDHYRALLRRIYGQTDPELGFSASSEHLDDQMVTEALRQRISNSSHIDKAVVALLDAQTDTIRRLDRRLGAPILAQQMRAHVTTLGDLLTHTVRDVARRPVAAILADAATLAGWQALDMGLLGQAWCHYETAKNAARAAESPTLLAHAKGEQGFALLDMDKAVEALLLVREAREQGGRRLPPRLISWLWAAEAETAAAAGFTADALRALDNADATLPAEAADPELPYLSLDECHLARWRGSTLARLGSADAIYQLERSLDRIGAEYNRARGGLHLDLAQALISAGAPDAAANHLAQGHDLAIQIGSVRQQQRLLKLAA